MHKQIKTESLNTNIVFTSFINSSSASPRVMFLLYHLWRDKTNTSELIL